MDDEVDVASLLAELLAADHHQVDTATNGVAALEKLSQHRYDLVLSDLRMPQLDGPGLYREVAERHPELARRFIAVTGDTLSPARREFLEREHVPSIAKPFDLAEVRKVVRQVLGGLPRPRP